jgi:hypothetical protein
MGKIRTWLLHADLIGKPFGLKINGRDTHQTIGGAIFSLIGILSVLTYATYLLVMVIQGEILNISYQVRNGKDRVGESMNLYQMNQLPTIGFIAGGMAVDTSGNIDLTTYFTIVVSMIKYKQAANGQTSQEVVNSFDYVLCPNKPTSLCPPEAAIKSLNVNFNTPDTKIGFSLSIYPCSRDTSCVDYTYIQAARLVLNYQDIQIDLDDKSNPLVRGAIGSSTEELTLNIYQSVVADRSLRLVEIVDSKGFPFGTKVSDRILTVEGSESNLRARFVSPHVCDRAIFGTDDCTPYGAYNYMMINTYTSYERTFRSFLSAFSEVGGFYSSVILVLQIIYTLINSSDQQDHMVQYLYGIRRQPQSMKYYFMCCQKKYRDQGTPKSTEDNERYTFVSTDIYKTAVETIDKGLDAVSLSKDITCLKFLLSYLFNEYQLKLVPLANLNKTIDNQEQQENNAKNKNKPVPVPYSKNGPSLKADKASTSKPSESEEEDSGIDRNSTFAAIKELENGVKNKEKTHDVQLDSKEKKDKTEEKEQKLEKVEKEEEEQDTSKLRRQIQADMDTTLHEIFSSSKFVERVLIGKFNSGERASSPSKSAIIKNPNESPHTTIKNIYPRIPEEEKLKIGNSPNLSP